MKLRWRWVLPGIQVPLAVVLLVSAKNQEIEHWAGYDLEPAERAVLRVADPKDGLVEMERLCRAASGVSEGAKGALRTYAVCLISTETGRGWSPREMWGGPGWIPGARIAAYWLSMPAAVATIGIDAASDTYWIVFAAAAALFWFWAGRRIDRWRDGKQMGPPGRAQWMILGIGALVVVSCAVPAGFEVLIGRTLPRSLGLAVLMWSAASLVFLRSRMAARRRVRG